MLRMDGPRRMARFDPVKARLQDPHPAMERRVVDLELNQPLGVADAGGGFDGAVEECLWSEDDLGAFERLALVGDGGAEAHEADFLGEPGFEPGGDLVASQLAVAVGVVANMPGEPAISSLVSVPSRSLSSSCIARSAARPGLSGGTGARESPQPARSKHAAASEPTPQIRRGSTAKLKRRGRRDRREIRSLDTGMFDDIPHTLRISLRPPRSLRFQLKVERQSTSLTATPSLRTHNARWTLISTL
jgi:hypothetical protein